MLKVGIIGAGHISESHIKSYQANGNCVIKAIADLNLENAQERAKEYGIEKAYSDYREILKDESIDAVSIATPTFTHKDIVIEALNSGKNVLCEKPPALNADEVRECAEVAKKTGKLLMYGFVLRFRVQTQFLKKYVEAGKMGRFVSADCVRVDRCSGSQAWFSSRAKGGGVLRDAAIHEIDNVLYLMGYPKPKMVVANQSFLNRDLPKKLGDEGWKSFDTNKYDNDVESSIEGFVVLDNGASIRVKTAAILNTINEARFLEISGENAGARIESGVAGSHDLKLVEIGDSCFVETVPLLEKKVPFREQINHFADCCLNGTECICKPEEAVALMQIIDAMYESADTGKPVIF